MSETLAELYPGRNGTCLIRLRNKAKAPIDTGWNGEALARFRSNADPRPHVGAMTRHIEAGGNVGWAVPPGVLVLDADTAQAAAWLERVLYDAPRQETAKGAHFVVKAPGALKIPQRVKVPIADNVLVDLRVAGSGQIVVEPSVHPSGHEYEWTRALPPDLGQLPDLPATIFENLKQALAKNLAPASESASTGMWAKGTQHNQLVRMAGRLRSNGHSVAEIDALLQVANRDRCAEPGTPGEIGRIAQSAEGWEKGEEPGNPQFEPLARLEPKTLEEFPVDAMGPASEFVAALAESTQTPPDIAGVCVLGFMAGAVARKFRVNAGWTEELALYLVAVGEPGSRKSEIWKHASKPIDEYEMTMREDTADEIRQNSTRLGLLKKRYSKAQARYADADDLIARREAETEAISIQKEISEAESGMLRPPRYLVSDITPEKLATLVAQNDERMILASAEGGQIFDRMFRYSQNGEPNMDLLLSGHAGERCSIDRQNAESIILGRPVLTVVGTLQPYTLESLSKQRGFLGRGLTARFAYSIPRDVRGYRDVRRHSPLDPAAVESYRRLIYRMLEIPHDPDNPNDLVVSGTALDSFHEFAQWAEEAQREGGEMEEIRGWASKSAGLVLRIAGVLSLAEDQRGEITPDVMRRAVSLGFYFADHSKRAFDVMNGLTGDAGVDKIWRWILNRDTPGQDFARQDLWQGVKGGRFKVAKDLESSLSRLVDVGRIVRRENLRPGPGRPAQVWAVNPSALERESTNAERPAPTTPENDQ